ncbi:MAG: hypothetical protein L6246_02400 [Thermodesulfovibrionales bacterium]|nr:hypothetical protein [Thermodesulfovibrionales bacterium]
MPRKLPEEFEGKELAPLCIASKLSEAKKIESVLDRKGIEYTFEIVEYSGRSVLSILFGGVKEGVMFKVLKEQYDFCRELLAKEGLEKNIVVK